MNGMNPIKIWPLRVRVRMHLLQRELSMVGLRGKVKPAPKRRKDLAITADNKRYIFYIEDLNKVH